MARVTLGSGAGTNFGGEAGSPAAKMGGKKKGQERREFCGFGSPRLVFRFTKRTFKLQGSQHADGGSGGGPGSASVPELYGHDAAH